MGIAAMNASLKNNRQLLKNGKRKPFSKMNGGGSKQQTNYKRYTLPTLPPHALRRIRRRVKRQNRLLFIKKLVTLIIVFGIILFFVTLSLL